MFLEHRVHSVASDKLHVLSSSRMSTKLSGYNQVILSAEPIARMFPVGDISTSTTHVPPRNKEGKSTVCWFVKLFPSKYCQQKTYSVY